MKRVDSWALAVPVAVLLGILALRPAGNRIAQTPSPDRAARVGGPPSEKSPSTPPPEVSRETLGELADALKAENRPATLSAARRLRDALMAFPDRIPDVLRILTDSAADPRLRGALAAILGSLPGDVGKRALAGALRSGRAAGIERAAVLALGIFALEDGEIFERDGLPDGVEIVPGLVAYVRGAISDGEIRGAVLERLLGAPAPETRRAAARVLRDSRQEPDVRRALLDRLSADPDAETAAEAGAALATWAASVPPEHPERDEILIRILDAAPRSEEVVRFRLIGPVASAALAPGQADQLRALAGHPSPETRLFAVDVLARRLGRFAQEDHLSVPVLARAALGDAEADVREAAALGLGRAASEPGVVETLAGALRSDPDWEVRAAAAASLGRAQGTSPAARQALEAAAASDPRAEVRATARRVLTPSR